MKHIILLLLILGATACTSDRKIHDEHAKPSNIIFLIGDGMGLSQVTATVYFGDQYSEFSRFTEMGLINTSSATHIITESSSGATAFSAGIKTYNKAIGVDTSRNAVKNITEWISEAGWGTGLVATSSITHATPASFYAHVNHRDMEQQIAAQLIDSEIDFFTGGGIRFFNKRRDGIDLFESSGEKNLIMDTTGLPGSGSLSPESRYGFLLADKDMPSMPQGRGDFLPDATKLAIEFLSNNKNGFFLMVEGSQIDWAAHDNESDRLIAETLDFEKSIKVALDFAEKDGHTLVVVTADHETGGFTLSGLKNQERDYNDYSVIEPSFATGGHSATLIPVFAYGPGAESFKGMYQNTEIFHKMMALLELGE